MRPEKARGSQRRPLEIVRFHGAGCWSYLLPRLDPCLNSGSEASSSLLEGLNLRSFPPSSTGSTTRCPVNGHIPIADEKNQQTHKREAHNASKFQTDPSPGNAQNKRNEAAPVLQSVPSTSPSATTVTVFFTSVQINLLTNTQPREIWTYKLSAPIPLPIQ